MLLIFLKCLLIIGVHPIHPFFVSVTEMEYRSGSGELDISSKFFTDDLEETLKAYSKQKVDLKNGDTAANKLLIEKYIKAHFKLSVNNKDISFTFLGFENDVEATWCYYSATGIQAVRTVRISSDFLYSFKKEQTNIFHLLVDGNRKSSRLSFPDTDFQASF